MLWFLRREDETIQIEARYDNDTLEYVAIVRYPDGTHHTERFLEQAVYREWLQAVERRLEREGWRYEGPPALIPDAFPTRKPPK
jgi:hypothetical protein